MDWHDIVAVFMAAVTLLAGAATLHARGQVGPLQTKADEQEKEIDRLRAYAHELCRKMQDVAERVAHMEPRDPQ